MSHQKKKTSSHVMFSIYSSIINREVASSLESRSPEIELEMYLSEPLSPISSDPLTYWSKSPYFRLCNASKKYLSAPSGSVESERLFSTAGLVGSKKRSSLNPEKLRQLVFLNKNLVLLNPSQTT